MNKLLTILSLSLVFSACQERPAEQSNKAATATTATDVSIVHNAAIYTAEKDLPKIEAFAYQGNKFVAVGSVNELQEKYPGAQNIDLDGATVVPGIIDAHGHLLGLGQSLVNVDLRGTKSKNEIIQVLKSRASSMLPGQWLLGRGWDQNDWDVIELPTAADLDQAFADRPVWLERVDGHANWANSKAMAVATKDLSGSWQPEGGEITRDENGNPSGIFVDNAVSLIQAYVPNETDEELTHALTLAMEKTASVGLTAMHDAGTSLRVWRLLEQLKQQDALDVRVYAMADGANEMLDYLCDNNAIVDPTAMLTSRSVKLYSDGALGSRGAALLSEYSDDPSNLGLLIESQETLTKHSTKAVSCGLQVNIHAIGDRGNRVTLDVLEAANAGVAGANNPGRHRIEHSQVIAIEDFQRFKDLSLIASVQPTHATSDMYWAEERVGADRIKGAYAWQKFAELGIPLALGSDFPVEKPEPLLGFYAAVSRQDDKGWPAEGWYPKEKLSRQQALHGFTLGAAYSSFQEHQLGSISVGKFADFVVLSNDIMTVPDNEILNTKVLRTVINGSTVFSIAE
ncbi:MAG: putative amidohydrolase YtcJ [Arenicella sp.]|jgi:predicted amidohydrolase YtcJ